MGRQKLTAKEAEEALERRRAYSKAYYAKKRKEKKQNCQKATAKEDSSLSKRVESLESDVQKIKWELFNREEK